MSVISGLLVGFIGGFALQRGGFCMHSAFRSIAFEKDHSLLRAWMLVLAINIPALLILEQFGIIFPARAPFTPFAGLVGAFGNSGHLLPDRTDATDRVVELVHRVPYLCG